MLMISHLNADGSISLKTVGSKAKVTHTSKELLIERIKVTKKPILGVLWYPNTVVFKEVHKEELSSGLNCLIDEIQSQDIKEFAGYVKRLIPEYFFSVPASSTGKYHPACDLGEGGLLRHTILVTKELIAITSIESTQQLLGLSRRAIDLMIVACMLHDSLKSGWQEDFEKNKYTKFEHPILAANMVRGMVGFLSNDDLNFIAHCIESHMGQWNDSTYSNVVLQKPSDKYQWLVHLADYLASRRDINYNFDGTLYVLPETKVVTVKNGSKKKLSEEDEKLLNRALRRPAPVVLDEVKETLEINRSEEECRDIWRTILKYKSYSEKQGKYIELARFF